MANNRNSLFNKNNIPVDQQLQSVPWFKGIPGCPDDSAMRDTEKDEKGIGVRNKFEIATAFAGAGGANSVAGSFECCAITLIICFIPNTVKTLYGILYEMLSVAVGRSRAVNGARARIYCNNLEISFAHSIYGLSPIDNPHQLIIKEPYKKTIEEISAEIEGINTNIRQLAEHLERLFVAGELTGKEYQTNAKALYDLQEWIKDAIDKKYLQDQVVQIEEWNKQLERFKETCVVPRLDADKRWLALLDALSLRTIKLSLRTGQFFKF